MPPLQRLANVVEQLTPADHQTHRRYSFEVPVGCAALHMEVRYRPKYLSADASRGLAERALAEQAATLAARLDTPAAGPDPAGLVERWAAAWAASRADRQVANLLTISLDDAEGRYRGAGHRHAAEQHLVLGPERASPGLLPGRLPAGQWQLVLSVHTLASARCDVSIQIGAETASSEPSGAYSAA